MRSSMLIDHKKQDSQTMQKCLSFRARGLRTVSFPVEQFFHNSFPLPSVATLW